jgi:hypothetical protein
MTEQRASRRERRQLAMAELVRGVAGSYAVINPGNGDDIARKYDLTPADMQRVYEAIGSRLEAWARYAWVTTASGMTSKNRRTGHDSLDQDRFRSRTFPRRSRLLQRLRSLPTRLRYLLRLPADLRVLLAPGGNLR